MSIFISASIFTTDSRKLHAGVYFDNFVDPFASERASSRVIWGASTRKVAISRTRARERLRYSGRDLVRRRRVVRGDVGLHVQDLSRDTVRGPYDPTSGRDYVKSLRL